MCEDNSMQLLAIFSLMASTHAAAAATTTAGTTAITTSTAATTTRMPIRIIVVVKWVSRTPREHHLLSRGVLETYCESPAHQYTSSSKEKTGRRRLPSPVTTTCTSPSRTRCRCRRPSLSSATARRLIAEFQPVRLSEMNIISSLLRPRHDARRPPSTARYLSKNRRLNVAYEK